MRSPSPGPPHRRGALRRSTRSLAAALLVSACSTAAGPGPDAAVDLRAPPPSVDGALDASIGRVDGARDRGAGDVGAASDLSSADAAAEAGCRPLGQATTNGGGRCAELNEAWTARGINVGYYPFRVLAPLEQYSGDYGGAAGQIFTPGGGAARGVILQLIPAGAYVGVSSTGPWYQPPTGCFPDGQSCGAPYRAACDSSSPPMRPAVTAATGSSYVWGYAYQGASHMQGWIPWDPGRLQFVGFEAAHPCALGPAGADFEVHEACGQATQCTTSASGGKNPTCGGTNACNEGADDCANTACGAQAGGPLTPSAHRFAVAAPQAAVACTTRTPPHPSVKCLPNGAAVDFFYVYPFGAYLYWAQNSTTKHWLHYGDTVQAYFHNRDAQGVLWRFVEVLQSGAPTLTPASDGTGNTPSCSSQTPQGCTPCKNGGACGWIQAVFLK